MKNFPKAGLLIFTLVIPALIFVFLQFFGRNHYDLPYFNPKLDASGKVVKANGDTVFNQLAETPQLPGNFLLNRKLTVLSYLPLNCEDSCKIALSQLQRIASLSGDLPDLQVVTLTADSSAREANISEMKGTGWQVAVAPEHAIAEFFKKDLGWEKLTENPFTSVLVDTNGFVRGYYHLTDSKETERLMAEIKILSYEGETKD